MGLFKATRHIWLLRDFQQTLDTKYIETSSLVMRPSTIKIILFVVSKCWDIKQVDVDNTFLNGDL